MKTGLRTEIERTVAVLEQSEAARKSLAAQVEQLTQQLKQESEKENRMSKVKVNVHEIIGHSKDGILVKNPEAPQATRATISVANEAKTEMTYPTAFTLPVGDPGTEGVIPWREIGQLVAGLEFKLKVPYDFTIVGYAEGMTPSDPRNEIRIIDDEAELLAINTALAAAGAPKPEPKSETKPEHKPARLGKAKFVRLGMSGLILESVEGAKRYTVRATKKGQTSPTIDGEIIAVNATGRIVTVLRELKRLQKFTPGDYVFEITAYNDDPSQTSEIERHEEKIHQAEATMLNNMIADAVPAKDKPIDVKEVPQHPPAPPAQELPPNRQTGQRRGGLLMRIVTIILLVIALLIAGILLQRHLASKQSAAAAVVAAQAKARADKELADFKAKTEATNAAVLAEKKELKAQVDALALAAKSNEVARASAEAKATESARVAAEAKAAVEALKTNTPPAAVAVVPKAPPVAKTNEVPNVVEAMPKTNTSPATVEASQTVGAPPPTNAVKTASVVTGVQQTATVPAGTPLNTTNTVTVPTISGEGARVSVVTGSQAVNINNGDTTYIQIGQATPVLIGGIDYSHWPKEWWPKRTVSIGSHTPLNTELKLNVVVGQPVALVLNWPFYVRFNTNDFTGQGMIGNSTTNREYYAYLPPARFIGNDGPTSIVLKDTSILWGAFNSKEVRYMVHRRPGY
ncbi:MAG: hypothetical protein V4481_01235 [Patescibacteria group bacterium]